MLILLVCLIFSWWQKTECVSFSPHCCTFPSLKTLPSLTDTDVHTNPSLCECVQGPPEPQFLHCTGKHGSTTAAAPLPPRAGRAAHLTGRLTVQPSGKLTQPLVHTHSCTRRETRAAAVERTWRTSARRCGEASQGFPVLDAAL